MKVILLQDIRGKGKKGQMIEASDGYARNYLLPRKMAVEATADNVNTMKMNDKAKAEQAAREKAQAQEIAEKLKIDTDALKKQAGISVDKKKIVQDEPIKSFGDFTLKAKLGYEIVATISVHVSEG